MIVRVAAATSAVLCAVLLTGASAGASPAAVRESGRMPVWQDCPTDSSLNEFVTGKNAEKGAYYLCVDATQAARNDEAAYALVQAFWALGSPLACGPEDDREGDYYDASSLVSRSYAAAGLDRFAPNGRSLSSQQILGQNGESQPEFILEARKTRPGDIVGYRSSTRARLYFVVMSAGSGSVITAAGSCGDVVRVTDRVKQRPKGPIKVGAYKVDIALARSE